MSVFYVKTAKICWWLGAYTRLCPLSLPNPGCATASCAPPPQKISAYATVLSNILYTKFPIYYGWGDAIPPIIFERGMRGGCIHPIIPPPNNLSYAAICDDLSCGFNGLPFLAMVTDCYSLFFIHALNQ